MHELAIAEQIRESVAAAAAAYPGNRVTSVKLSVGQLRAIEPDTMQLCWQAVTQDSCMSGSVIEIEEVVAMGRCRSCREQFEAEDLVFVCPVCGNADVETLCGKELLVDRINLE
jgi:hydrogenase nickel incorporation protein HypA/HybF